MHIILVEISYKRYSLLTSAWSSMRTSTCTHSSSLWEDTLSMSTGDTPYAKKVSVNFPCILWIHVSEILVRMLCLCFLLGSLQSFRLRLKDLVKDMLIDCLGEGPRREASPEGWEVEEVGPETGICKGLPVFSWSFSALRFSTVDYHK